MPSSRKNWGVGSFSFVSSELIEEVRVTGSQIFLTLSSAVRTNEVSSLSSLTILLFLPNIAQRQVGENIVLASKRKQFLQYVILVQGLLGFSSIYSSLSHQPEMVSACMECGVTYRTLLGPGSSGGHIRICNLG